MTELPLGWANAALEDLGRWCGGGTPSKHETRFWQLGAIPWVSPKDMKALVIHDTEDHITELAIRGSATNLVDAGAVLVVTRSGILQHSLPVATTARPVAINQDLKALTPHQGVLSEYVAWGLRANEQRILRECSKGGTTVQSVETSRLLRFPLPIAPTAEQVRIVAAIEERLFHLDAGVSAIERVQRTCQRLSAAVLSSLLLDEDGQRWPTTRMEAVLEAGRYGTSTKCGYGAAGLPVLRIPNVQSGRINMEDLKRAIDRRVDLSGSIVEEGDVLIIRTNGSRSLIGRAAVVPAQSEPLSFASYLIQLKVDRARIDPHYLVVALSAPVMRRRIEDLAATTAGQYNVSLDKLRSLAIPLPPLAHQLRQVTWADDYLSMIGHLEITLDWAKRREQHLRSSILTEAFAGKLVPQDQSDEPADDLLARIVADHDSSKVHKPTRTRKPRLRITA